MRLSWALLKWQSRAALPATALACLVVWPVTLLTSGQLYWPLMYRWYDDVLMLVLAHGLALLWCLGRSASPAAAFLYTRGFTRDQLWAHTALAASLSMLTVVLGTGLILWSGLRSSIQDHAFASPYYPGAAHLDYALPLHLAAYYGLALTLLLYVWERFAKPWRGFGAAFALPVLIVWAVGELGGRRGMWWWSALAVVVGLLVFVSWRGHRQMEVGQ